MGGLQGLERNDELLCFYFGEIESIDYQKAPFLLELGQGTAQGERANAAWRFVGPIARARRVRFTPPPQDLHPKRSLPPATPPPLLLAFFLPPPSRRAPTP